MKRVAVIQARVDSRRLPGKVLMPIAGRPMLEQQVRRVSLCRSVDTIVIATSARPADDEVADLGHRLGVAVVRGSLPDVLERVRQAATEHGADIVVRLTADCPLADPEVIDLVIERLVEETGCDYASNVIVRTYPHGLDAEALWADVLTKLASVATSAEDREHVTSYLRFGRPELFRVVSVVDVIDNSDLRWTVDGTEDLDLVRSLFERLGLDDEPIGYREIVAAMRADPSLSRLNARAAAQYPADGGFVRSGRDAAR